MRSQFANILNSKSEIVFLWHKPENQGNIEMEVAASERAEARYGSSTHFLCRPGGQHQANLKVHTLVFSFTRPISPPMLPCRWISLANTETWWLDRITGITFF